MLHRSQRQPARLRLAAFAWAGILGLGMVIAGCSAGGSPATGASGPPAATGATSSQPPPSATPRITGRTVAGPTCPVAKNPPDPACADRPVAGAVVVVRNGAGAEIARMTTAADGSFAVMVPGGGSYTVEAQPHKGLMRAPAATVVTLPNDAAASVDVTLTYDTGIR
jgi:hypothetical protein